MSFHEIHFTIVAMLQLSGGRYGGVSCQLSSFRLCFLQIFFWCDHEIAVSGDLEILNVQNFLARESPSSSAPFKLLINFYPQIFKNKTSHSKCALSLKVSGPRPFTSGKIPLKPPPNAEAEFTPLYTHLNLKWENIKF